LFLAYNGPYGLGTAMHEPIRNRHRATYAEATLPSFPRIRPQPWNHNYGARIGELRSIRKYAAEISGIDDGVGRVMATLRQLDLDDNTLVVFTADQGMSGGHSGYWGMGDHTRPLTAFDWTTHVPLIFRLPKRAGAGVTSELLVSNVDFMPTMLELLGLARTTPGQPDLSGRSYAAALSGEQVDGWEHPVYYEFENVRAIRTDRWKYIERFAESPNELYDLAADPAELNNLIDQAEHRPVQQGLAQGLHAYFTRIADPKWDLWNGGSSKTKLIMRKLFQNPGPVPAPMGRGGAR
jgi:arylsulfatase A-like enzyme